MTPHFLLCAERAARTSEGLFVLHGVIERLTTKEDPTADKPLTVPSMSIAFEIREADLSRDRQVRVTLHHRESGAEIFNHGFQVQATNDPARKISGLLNFHLLPIKALGTYDMRVEVEGEEAAKNHFLVVKTV